MKGGEERMEYPKRFMKASEMAALTGIRKQYFSDLVHFPGQNFARKMGNARNSAVIIDTELYEKWHQRRVKSASRR